MTMMPIALTVYAAMSVVTFIAYASDKRAARSGRARTSEATLHALEALGGWPGALIAQQLLQHKNAKVGYQMAFWLIVVVHVAAWALLARWR